MARASVSPAPPRVSAPDLPRHLKRVEPARGADLLQATLHLSGDVDLAHSSLEQCLLTADAERVDLTGATVLDVAAKDLRIASMSLRNAGIRRLRITGGRIGTLDLSGSRLDELEIRDVRIDYLTFGGAKGSDILIADSTIRTLDLPQAEITRMAFVACRSDEVDPRGLRAKDVDLRGLDAEMFTDANGLRGTTLTTFQIQKLAPAIAAGLGIQIKD
ncbi:pentapeptide repeat-containing protein [Microbacterium sp.]|uniref:pentapeptide repeat-containing protein n=1 Tax=Microbacterium sp. TaxID=51671 RepID=UPI002734D51F|nr:pentapeptide repeat-containing protein [Microbacterium sp.]MDP3949637.1 pentapeptide repeat-containing protein [Microbacterium sp.]